MYQYIKVPADGAKIKVLPDHSLQVPDEPIIPYIEGDGTGFDITPVMMQVVDAAVRKAYGGQRRIRWMVVGGEERTDIIELRVSDVGDLPDGRPVVRMVRRIQRREQGHGGQSVDRKSTRLNSSHT